MIYRIKKVVPEKNFTLMVEFDDGRSVTYVMTEDINSLPGYSDLKSIYGLFDNVHLDGSRTCVYWNDYIDLPSDEIYQYGKTVTGDI